MTSTNFIGLDLIKTGIDQAHGRKKMFILDWMGWLGSFAESFATSKAAWVYLVGGEGGLFASLFMALLPRYRKKMEAFKDKKTISLLWWIPIEFIIWTPLVILLAVVVDFSPLVSVIIGLGHEPIYLRMQKSFDNVGLLIMGLLGKLPGVPPAALPEPTKEEVKAE